VSDHADERNARDDLDAIHQRGLGGVLGGHEHMLITQVSEATDGDENTVYVTDRPVERQLTEKRAARRRDLAVACQRDRHGDGKVEAAAFLAQLGGREVDGQPGAGILETAVLDGRPNPLSGFLDRRRGEADQEEPRVAAATDVSLHLNPAGLQTDKQA
jgi:hypothetical protein